ncbi:3-hydroxyacyl-CoA dehydrogenase/enoyl-CoA hydratase/3-hydroxybutyryl-CoA epimerase [Cricetibacter osteomyelitidis]|uniref:enoyl-CoA hydratase n=1 Tax=Cricetibacter osteomyelitidis TaxID=1521931 RepID=A0A4R2T6J4_9PAST|nr:3-hydroxyacyl-CoA dehydrogenase NAD-binding domain-containing protein [Cricetibacter osteomyelitidis]TCP96484.1 3-hydroxyacyl-CoA dehydrogenase/enoyl-CoA hydratase/3-hydroxybutyryl-CoA epimerase [Cricetibacter osteomyelitidis]
MTEQHSPFTLEVRDNIAIVHINTPNKPYNLFTALFPDELRAVLGTIIYQQYQGVVFFSNKPNNFIRGFDLACLEGKSAVQITEFSEQVQLLMREIEGLKCPTVAAIHGDCYGIGLELALACTARIASQDENTKFAIPQVKSGLLPFAGGTQRLPQLIGLKDAVPLLLSGDKINARTALQLGLLEDVVAKEVLLDTALLYLKKQQNQTHNKPAEQNQKFFTKVKNVLAYSKYTRNRVLTFEESNISHKAFGSYEAIQAIINILKLTDEKEGLKAERESLSKLFFTKESAVLRHLEQTARAMKLQYRERSQVRDVNRLAILGSGFIGAGIAYITAHRANIPVRIKDIHPAGIQQALHRTYELLQKEVADGTLSIGKMRQQMQLISGGERFIGNTKADFVIEAVYEDLRLKQQMVVESEQFFDEHTVFATNASTLSIAEIASVAQRPQNVIGVHYFSPVTERKMLEIIPHLGVNGGQGTSEQTIATAIHFAMQQGKIPFLVADKAGFFVNRILTPYLLEAIRCIEDGESIEFIDRSLQEFGFSIGPLAMIDEMGLDVLVKSIPHLVQAHGSRFALPNKVALLTENDRKGAKNRRGFYLYHSADNIRSGEDKSIYHVMETITRNDLEAEQVARRCVLMMINEAAYCLQDNVIRNIDEGNVASVLGAFFPDFRGGIYAYIEQIGAKNIVAELNRHVELYGDRFTPCAWLVSKSSEN